MSRWLAGCALLLAACSDSSTETTREIPADSWLADPSEPLPERIEDLGLHLDLDDLDVVPDAAIAYEPQWPLWSSGSLKTRHLVLPEGAPIDTSDPQAWQFPAGAALFKTFAYVRDGQPVPVETRVMHVEPDGGWAYNVYAWDSLGEGAILTDAQFPVPVEVDTDMGPLTHTIPARLECRECHESARSFVLGFEALQLGDQAADIGEVFTQAPSLPPPIDTGDAATDEVLGLFVGQCVHCHNGSDGPSSAFDLRPEVAIANTLDQPTESSAMASGIRIVPGDPGGSILFQAFSGETNDPEVGDMPPLGIDRRDAQAVELLRSWIAAL